MRGVRKELTFDIYPVTVRAVAKNPAGNAVEFARERLGFVADERQAEVLLSEAKRGILNCSRQWGKSTVAAAKAVHRAVSVAGSTVLVASPSSRQSAEFLDKAQKLMRRAGMPVRGDGNNEVSLAFGNGSRIVGLPGVEATVRGFSSISLLWGAFDNSDYAEQRFMRSMHANCLSVAASMESYSR